MLPNIKPSRPIVINTKTSKPHQVLRGFSWELYHHLITVYYKKKICNYCLQKRLIPESQTWKEKLMGQKQNIIKQLNLWQVDLCSNYWDPKNNSIAQLLEANSVSHFPPFSIVLYSIWLNIGYLVCIYTYIYIYIDMSYLFKIKTLFLMPMLLIVILEITTFILFIFCILQIASFVLLIVIHCNLLKLLYSY